MIYKMLVLNIDGTLLQDNGRLNKLTRDAIEYASGKGIAIVLATSRNFPSAKRVAKSLKTVTSIVAHQGAFIGEDLNNPIFVKSIEEQTAGELAALLESYSCRIKFVHEKFSVGNKVELPEGMMAKVVFHAANRFTYPERFVEGLSESLLDEPVAPPHIEVIFSDRASLLDAKKTIESMYDEVACIEKEETMLDLVPSGVSKLNGVRLLCERLDIRNEEVVAIGSGLDDIPLVEWAGLGVAMKNSPSSLQEAANWITRTNSDHGVAYMVKEHFRRQQRIEFLKQNNISK